ncbi:3'-5' exonuclease [Nocardia elegans]|uniref:3'-5' exonuclease n=1 Tax=Nocardia elegans TaxID=300029 RepID=A0ABW6TQD7_9NOCA
MSSWTEMPLTAVDTETTGTDVFGDRVVTACVVDINGSRVEARNWLADPGVEIPAGATEVHGITTEHARQYGRPHAEVVAEVVDAMYAAWAANRAVVIYNAAFDVSLIAANYPGFEVRGLIVDPYVIDRELDTYRPGKRTLAATCEHYGVRLEGAHSADGDALAAARLAWKLPRRYPVLELADADGLMEAQAEWHKSRQLDFIDYLSRNRKPFHDVSIEWPVRTPKAKAA